MKNFFRPYLHDVTGYSSARDEFEGTAEIYLDANENPYNNGYNRYPDSRQKELRHALAQLKDIAFEQIFLSNGSDVIVDKLIRLFCEPGQDKILINTPTFPLYAVMAKVNNIRVIEVPKTHDYQLDVDQIIFKINNEHPKIVFLCSPNNPVGNSLDRDAIHKVIASNPGITVLDEAYCDFTNDQSLLPELNKYPRLAILQTFSKSWALAGLRLGACYGPGILTQYLYKISAPYSVNIQVLRVALQALEFPEKMKSQVAFLLREKKRVQTAIQGFANVSTILPSSTNFLVVGFKNHVAVYQALARQGIVVRNVHKSIPNHLRITIGNKQENNKLIKALSDFSIK